MKEHFLPIAMPDMGRDEIEAVQSVLESGFLTTGPKVFEFENALSDYLSNGQPLHTTALISCTACLFLALKALGIKPEDEVIVPTWTFAATSQVVEWIGARPVFCDVEEDTLNIDVEKAELLVTSKTAAIIPVHMFGYPCDMDRIHALADTYRLKVIEDAAHAIGTKYKGKKIGNFSDITCFSFYATKNMAMGEGGAAVSKDAGLVDKISKLSYFGINKEAYKRYDSTGTWFYDIEELGYKFNLDSMHAAIGLVQLKKLDQMNNRRRKIARLYKKYLDSEITFTKDSKNHYHTYHLFPIILPDFINRDNFIQDLKQANIGSSVHFIPLHKHSRYRNQYKENHFPTSEKMFENILSIPMFASMTDKDVEYIVHHINRLIGRHLNRST